MSTKKYDQDFGVVNDDQIRIAFAYANFGYRDEPDEIKIPARRKLIQQGVLKTQTNYHNGHTMKCILEELGLVSPKLRVTVKGRRFLFLAFQSKRYS